MCKVFPFSLGPAAMRWFDSLKANSISSFRDSNLFPVLSHVVEFLGSWLPYYLWACNRVKVWKHTQKGIERCLTRLMVILMNWPSVLSSSDSPSIMVWGSLLLANLSPVCVNWWTGLTSIKGSKRISSKGKGRGRIKLSLRKEGIIGQIVTITIDHKGILRDNQGRLAFKRSMPCLES